MNAERGFSVLGTSFAPRRRWFLALSGLLVAACVGCAARADLHQRPAAPPGPVVPDTRAIVERLADDELEGRLTGSDGIRKAAEYIIEQLEAIGAEPLPGLDGFRQAFSYTAGVTGRRHDDAHRGSRRAAPRRARW